MRRLAIILNVPFALIGGILGLFVSRQYLSVPASLDFIALFGVSAQRRGTGELHQCAPAAGEARRVSGV
jgi:Cu/Ag efflux pump CusA